MLVVLVAKRDAHQHVPIFGNSRSGLIGSFFWTKAVYASRNALADSPEAMVTSQGCTLPQDAVRCAVSRMDSMVLRGTGVGRNALQVWRRASKSFSVPGSGVIMSAFAGIKLNSNLPAKVRRRNAFRPARAQGNPQVNVHLF